MATLTRMYQRRGTAAQWANVASTVILQAGEVGFETDTGKFKIGNGVDTWINLSYYLKDSQNAGIYAKLSPEAPEYRQNITGGNIFSPQSATQTPIVVSGVSGQSAVLQRWRDVGDNTLASIDAAGKITATGGLFNGQVDVNSNKIVNVATPTSANDAANKAYVDATKQGLLVKDPVRVATTGNITLSGTQTIDGVAVVAGNRVLVKNQTTGSQNGIYVVASGGWSRADDANVSSEVLPGMFVFVSEGTTNADSGWVLTTDGTITLGTTSLSFVQFSGAGQITAGSGMTKNGNTLDVVGTANRITANADSIDIASTYVGQTSITTLGTVTTGTWSASTIAANRGGTGQTSYTIGDILYADSTSTLAKRASGTAGLPLLAGGAGVAPNYGTIATAAIADSTSTTTGVTYSKLQYVSAQWRVLGRKSSSAGVVEELAPNDIISMIGQGTTTLSFNRLPATTSGGNNGTASTLARGDHTHTIGQLSDVVISGTPVARQVIKFNGTNWVNEVPSGGIVIGATPPSQPAAGDGWFNSNDGGLYIYYDDGAGSPSAQWVQVKANSALEASILTRVSALEAQQTDAAYNIIPPKTVSYTLANGDQNDLIQMNSSSAMNLLIPTDATVNFPIGTKVEVLQIGTGQVTIAAVTPGTTTVNGTPGLKLRAQWAHASLVKRAANTWVVFGDTVA